MPKDSVGAEDADSCEYDQCGMDWYISKDSL